MSTRSVRKARRAAGRRKASRQGVPSRQVEGTDKLWTTPARDACLQMQWRASFEATTEVWPAPLRWYGTSPAWRVAVEASTRREYGDRLRVTEWRGRVEYRIALDVRGPNDLVEVAVVFYADPPYETYRLHPQDYPRVWAERGLPSKHRMPDDDALCFYYPADPPERRWTADKGLLDLLDLVVDHLGYEAYWRASGGHDGGQWLGDEVEHGFTQEAAR